MGVLLVAAGGGGDALAAVVIHRALRPEDAPPTVLTYAWERLRVDPLPGPRGPDGFVGLVPAGRFTWQITPGSDTVPSGLSMLPRLAAEVPARLLLIDPTGGARGMHRQLAEQVTMTGADAVWVVDVGGDVVARGDEPGLRSPFADGLALAACVGLPVPVEVLIAGPGLDGELPEAEVIARVEELGGHLWGRLTGEQATPAADVLVWHPSEATALLTAAAMGVRGRVEIRDNGTPIDLTDHSADIYGVRVNGLTGNTLHVRALAETETLTQAEEVIRRLCGSSEIDYERQKSARLSEDRPERPANELRHDADAYTADARTRGIDYLTFRRLAEALDVSPGKLDRLRAELRQDQATDERFPLWPVQGQR
ncbi:MULTISPECIES: DUF1152 domain-containing protein [Frankia]|uniref:DUF1152 domain-containing protein n=1 Tax=Frankia TaxID=1854 RepID=UPI0002FA5A11|nr:MULTISPECIES: DUF1152 domain-containing protein [Frankia]